MNFPNQLGDRKLSGGSPLYVFATTCSTHVQSRALGIKGEEGKSAKRAAQHPIKRRDYGFTKGRLSRFPPSLDKEEEGSLGKEEDPRLFLPTNK